jgi:hypothetical protein
VRDQREQGEVERDERKDGGGVEWHYLRWMEEDPMVCL